MNLRFDIAAALDIAELESLWLDLEAQASPPFFLSWDWIGSWLHEAALEPTVLIGRQDGRIALLGILVPSARRDVLPIAVHGMQLHMTGDARQDVITIEYNGFLVSRAAPDSAQSEAVAFLLSGIPIAGHRCDEVHLKNISANLARTIAPVAGHCRELQRKPSWRVDLAAVRDGGRQYLDTISANTRQQIRRAMRQYERRGRLIAVRAGSVPQAMEFLAGLKELHQRYWTERGAPGAFAYPFFERFQQRLIETGLPHGTVEILRVAAGSDVIGYVYNFVYRGHVYAYQTGFHYEDDKRLKPGLVSHCLCIERHIADGSTVYDFMAGDNRYKANLGKPGPEMVYLLAARPTWNLRLEAVLVEARRRIRALARPA